MLGEFFLLVKKFYSSQEFFAKKKVLGPDFKSPLYLLSIVLIFDCIVFVYVFSQKAIKKSVLEKRVSLCFCMCMHMFIYKVYSCAVWN